MIIVSLTTIPSRFKYLDITINSILAQTIMPDKIIIHIPSTYNNYPNNYILPEFSDDRIIINNDVNDYGPATKLLGLYNYKIYNDMVDDDIIIVIDDDRTYNNNLIQNMLTYHAKHTNKVLTVAGWDIELLTINKYTINDKKQPRGIEFKTDGYKDFLGGCCGFLINENGRIKSKKDVYKLLVSNNCKIDKYRNTNIK